MSTVPPRPAQRIPNHKGPHHTPGTPRIPTDEHPPQVGLVEISDRQLVDVDALGPLPRGPCIPGWHPGATYSLAGISFRALWPSLLSEFPQYRMCTRVPCPCLSVDLLVVCVVLLLPLRVSDSLFWWRVGFRGMRDCVVRYYLFCRSAPADNATRVRSGKDFQNIRAPCVLPVCAPGTSHGQSRFAFASLCACKAFLLKKQKKTKQGVPGKGSRA